MSMTHYMELLAVNQPWNLLIFMAGPVILAETLAVTELYLLLTRKLDGPVALLNRGAGVLVGVYFIGIIAYLMINAVIPLSTGGGWRGWIDMTAVGFYLLGGLPMIGIALLETGQLAGGRSREDKLKLHAGFVAAFLVLAHIAMIFGMMDPTLGGWVAPVSGMHHG
jgi:hypothetical protein